MLNADFILFRPVKSDVERLRLLQIHNIDDFSTENLVFEAWLSNLTASDGIQTVSESSVKLVKIIDMVRFENVARQFMAKRS